MTKYRITKEIEEYSKKLQPFLESFNKDLLFHKGNIIEEDITKRLIKGMSPFWGLMVDGMEIEHSQLIEVHDIVEAIGGLLNTKTDPHAFSLRRMLSDLKNNPIDERNEALSTIDISLITSMAQKVKFYIEENYKELNKIVRDEDMPLSHFIIQLNLLIKDCTIKNINRADVANIYCFSWDKTENEELFKTFKKILGLYI